MKETSLTVTLPWPNSALSPNSRNQWGKIRATKDARVMGCYAMLQLHQEAPVQCPPGPLAVLYKFYPPSSRWLDDDNLIASMKSARDGIFDFFGTNDHAVVITSGRRCEVRRGGVVEVTISEDHND